MKRVLICVLSIILVLVLAGCGKNALANDDEISIVVTAFPHYDFARQLTKNVDNVSIKMLISPGGEVHTYEPSPSDVLAISGCDLFIYTGGESDTWATGILESTSIDDMSVISFMDICAPDGCTTDEHNHEHGHEHEYDEHVWTLPLFAKAICEHISRELCRLDEENAALYNANLEGYLEKLSGLDKEFDSIMKDAKRDSIIVADRFPFYHLASYYKLKYHAAYSGCSSSTEPSASVIASLSEKVKSENIPYVFTIEFSNGKIAGSVIEGKSAQVLTLHSCHNVSEEDFNGGITYYDLMMQNAQNLRKALCE